MRRKQIWALTGRDIYDYDALCDIEESALGRYCISVRQQFVALAKDWATEKNTEWIARHYLAVKYILAAQLKASAAAYAKEINLRIVVPYLHYYVLLHSCRAFLLTRPNESVTIGNASHSKIINCATAAMGSASGTLRDNLNALLIRSQAMRELFSYRFPASGLKITNDKPSSEDVFLWAKRLVELAELNSECLTSALTKHCMDTVEVDWHQLADLCGYETPEHELDRDDYHRLAYLNRTKFPSELACTARPGLTEDFFGAWAADEDLGAPEHAFDPYQGYGPSLFDFL